GRCSAAARSGGCGSWAGRAGRGWAGNRRCFSCACSRRRHRLDRVDDGLIAGAPAVIAGEVRADRLAGRNAAATEQLLRGEQHARRAKAALQRVARDEGALQVGELAAVGAALDGPTRRAAAVPRQHQAATPHPPVDAPGARPAHAVLAADVAASQPEILAQEVDQGLARVDALAHLLAVHGDGDVVEALAHACASPSSRATRRNSTPARWILTAPEACTSSGGGRSVSAPTAASTSPLANARSASRARTAVAPTPKKASRTSSRRLPSARAQAASPTIA